MSNTCNSDNVYLKLFKLTCEVRELQKLANTRRKFASECVKKEKELDILLDKIKDIQKKHNIIS